MTLTPEQRAVKVTVTVKGCMKCPNAKPSPFSYSKTCNLASTVGDSQRLFHENVQGLTPSCPMWAEAKPIGELK